MKMKEFDHLEKVIDPNYKDINLYKIDDAMFFVEPNFYTQLVYIKDHFADKYQQIVDEIINTAKRNKKVIFTANFEEPVVYYDDYIYRELEDILAVFQLSFDNKANPDSDWKD